MKKQQFVPVVVGMLLFSGVLAACKPSRPEPDQVSLQLNWYHETEFAGYYVAEANGFYTDENIEVAIFEGGLDVSTKWRLLDREVDFGVLTFDKQQRQVVKERPLVAVMAVFQIPPPVLLALADSGIHEPQDLVGRRVAIKDEPWQLIIHSTLTSAGIDPSEIIAVEVETDTIEMLYNGEVDVWTGYAHNEPTQARLAGYDVNLIFPADYGVGYYDGLLIVHQDTLEQDPDLVARFVRASLRGWQYAIKHPDEAAEVIAQWQPDKSLEFYQLAMSALIPLVDTLQGPIGWIDAERWQRAMGAVYTPERPGYTMEFVQGAQ